MSDYKVILEWAYWDGLQSGVCEKDGIKYIFSMRDWEDMYPIDEKGKDIPRIYDLYSYDPIDASIIQMPQGYVGWDDWFDKYLLEHEIVGECDESQFAPRKIDG